MEPPPRPKIIVSALVEQNGNYLLIRERLESDDEYWIVPGGSVEFGESLEQALKREFKEETNLDIAIDRFVAFKEAIYPQYHYHTVIFFYLAHPLSHELKLEPKVLDGQYFSPVQAFQLKLVDTARWILEQL